jgi:hypothetical protein
MNPLPETIFIPSDLWDQVRHKFSEQEKDALRAAAIGTLVCPKGVVINPKLLKPELLGKFLEFGRVAGPGAIWARLSPPNQQERGSTPEPAAG